MTPPYPDEPEDGQEDESWERPAPPSSLHGTAPSGKPTWVRRTRGLVLKTWEPKSLPRPKVDRALARFTALERSAEVFRYNFNRAEYWLSPGGWLREWIRLNIRLAFLLAIPALLVGPLVTRALAQLSAWVTLLNNTTSAMVLFPLSAVLVLGLICLLIYVCRMLPFRRPPGHPHHQDRYY
jgi:hypothetical protein